MKSARHGSPWTGLGVVVAKETADHLSSARMRILEALVFLTALYSAYLAIQAIRQTIDYGLSTIEKEDEDEIEYVEEPGAPNPFLIYGRAGEPCPKCHTRVQSFTQGGRTTHFCPVCQPKRPRRR